MPPCTPLSSSVTTSLCAVASARIASGTGSTQRGSTTVTPMPWLRRRCATASAIEANDPTATSSTSSVKPSAGTRQHVDPVAPLERRNVFADSTLREPEGGRAVLDLERLAEFLTQPGAVARCGHPHTGHDAQHRQVPHAVVAGAVGPGDPGAVQHDRHRQLVQRNVHHHLIERAVEECRVDGDDGVHATHRQPGGRGHRVLLGDADIEEPVRVALPERREPGRARASPR